MDFPLMQTSPGITIPRFSQDPLGTEGELTAGPDDINPYNSVKEQEAVKQIREQRRRKFRNGEPVKTVPQGLPPASLDPNPADGNDPYAYDDVGDEVDRLRLPGLNNGIEPVSFDTGEMFQF